MIYIAYITYFIYPNFNQFRQTSHTSFGSSTSFSSTSHTSFIKFISITLTYSVQPLHALFLTKLLMWFEYEFLHWSCYKWTVLQDWLHRSTLPSDSLVCWNPTTNLRFKVFKHLFRQSGHKLAYLWTFISCGRGASEIYTIQFHTSFLSRSAIILCEIPPQTETPGPPMTKPNSHFTTRLCNWRTISTKDCDRANKLAYDTHNLCRKSRFVGEKILEVGAMLRPVGVYHVCVFSNWWFIVSFSWVSCRWL